MAEVSFELKVDNRDLLQNATDEAIMTALSACGMQAEGYAKMKCRVDTGLLRNSITWAVQGKEVNMKEYQSNGTHADTDATRRAGTAGQPADRKRGVYSGHLDTGIEYSVAIGSNVAYAAYVEMGVDGKAGHPYLRPALQDHVSEYKRLLEEYLAKINI